MPYPNLQDGETTIYGTCKNKYVKTNKGVCCKSAKDGSEATAEKSRG